MTTTVRAIVLVCVSVLAAQAAPANEDVRSWHSVALKPVVTDYAEVVVTGNARFYDWSTELSYAFVGVRAQYKVWHPFYVGIGYLNEQAKRTTGSGFQTIHRGQFFFGRTFNLAERWSAISRHQLEVRNYEDRDDNDLRSRHLLQFSYARPDTPFIASFGINNELFFSYDQTEFSENRFSPIIIRFKPWHRIGVIAFGMIRSQKKVGRWDHYFIGGWAVTWANKKR